MPDLRAKLMTFLRLLRDPKAKPPDIETLDKRLDRVDERLNRLADGYRRGDVALHRR